MNLSAYRNIMDQSHSIQKIIAAKIKMLRMKNGLTQKNLARRARIHWTYVTKIETGKKLPSLKVICALADSLDVKAHELLIPEETHGKLGQKRDKLIKILKESSEKELETYWVLITALRKSQH